MHGATGATGTTGSKGTKGTTGTQGATGATGATGAKGTTGTAGAHGATGATGSAGTQGATGATGATGSAGTQGATGATGAGGTAGTTPLSAIQLTPVTYVAATPIAASTYTNTNGTLTATTNGTFTVTPAFVSPPTSSRVALVAQATQAHNGIYTVTNTGSGSTKFVLTRATTMNTSAKCQRVLTARVAAASPNTGSYAKGSVAFIPVQLSSFVLGTTHIVGIAGTNGYLLGEDLLVSGGIIAASGTTIHLRPTGSLASTTTVVITKGHIQPKSGSTFSTKTCVTIVSPHTVSSGTAFQCTATKDTEITFSVSLAGTLTMTYAATSSGTAHVIHTAIAVVAGTVITKRIPASWYVKITLTTATVSTVKIQSV